MSDERYEPTAEERARMETLRKELEKTFEEAIDWGIEAYEPSPAELKFFKDWRRDLREKKKRWARFEKQIGRDWTALLVMGAIGSLRAAKRDHENGEEDEVHERRKDRARLLELAKAAELLAKYFEDHGRTRAHLFACPLGGQARAISVHVPHVSLDERTIRRLARTSGPRNRAPCVPRQKFTKDQVKDHR
jgi:hypothetical protein